MKETPSLGMFDHNGASVDLRYAGPADALRLHRFAASRRLCDAAQRAVRDHQVGAIRTWAAASDALIPLARGYQAMCIVNAGPDQAKAPRERSQSAEEILRAADFVEAVVRDLDTAPAAL